MRVPRAVRAITDPLLERVPVVIPAGPNRGRFWSLVSIGSGHWNGRREAARLQLIAALVRPGDVVWDAGAHHGYTALLASRLVGPSGEVHTFEPGARNLRLLRRHLWWNVTRNVYVHPCALGAADGRASFGGPGTSKTLALGGGAAMVEVRSAKSLIAAGECRPPTFFKIDVEGSEPEVLAGAIGALPPESCLLVALHSATSHERCMRRIQELGFRAVPSRALEAALKGPWGKADPDMLCLGPRRAGADEDEAALRESGL